MNELRLTSILCAFEFSRAGTALVRYASCLAIRMDAQLTLLHVASATGLELSMLRPVAEDTTRFARIRNHPLRYEMESYPGEGPIGEAARLARRENFDLLILPTPRRGMLRRWMGLEPAGARLLSALECPVITAATLSLPGHAGNMDTILCATRAKAPDNRVLDAATGLAKRFGAGLHVVDKDPILAARRMEASLIVTGRESNGLMFSDQGVCPVLSV
ncbi:MAG: universal stress protein [Bryobacteraceae bacterium]|nr:universal stress protein [Bryobacteraceae bacterium]